MFSKFVPLGEGRWRRRSGEEGGGQQAPWVQSALPLLASPVETSGREAVVWAQVAVGVSQAHTGSRFCRHAHLHGEGSLQGQATQPWRQTGERREWRCRHGGREQASLVRLEVFPCAHCTHGLALSQHVQLRQSRGVLRELRVAASLEQ